MHLSLMKDGEVVCEADVIEDVAAAYIASFPPAYVPQEYPKWVSRAGEVVLVESPPTEAEAEPPAPAPAAEPEVQA